MADSESRRCEICGSEFPEEALEEAMLEVQATQTQPRTVCQACRIVYNNRPTDGGCRACGASIETGTDGYRISLVFPATRGRDGPLAEVSGELCPDCARRIGMGILSSGIHGRESYHERFLQALTEQERSSGRTPDERDAGTSSDGEAP